MEEKDTWKERACADDFTFATPAPVPSAIPPASLYVSTGAGKRSQAQELRRSPRKKRTQSKIGLEEDQGRVVQHIHVSTTEDLVRLASQEAAELEYIASKCQKVKEKSKPKRPSGSFLFFLNEYRSRAVKDAALQNKKINLGKVTKEAGILWREMDDAQKRPYQELVEKDRERYMMEKKESSPQIQESNSSLPGKSGTQDESGIPLSSSLKSYQQYLQDQIDDLQNRLNMFQSRYSQPAQLMSQAPAQQISAQLSPEQQPLLYVDHSLGQQHKNYQRIIPGHTLHLPASEQNQGQTQEQQEEERINSRVCRGRTIL